MVKKRKSIRKAPTVVMIEGEEQLFETNGDPTPNGQTNQGIDLAATMVVDDHHLAHGLRSMGRIQPNGIGPNDPGGDKGGRNASEDGEEDSEDTKAREKALEEWNEFKEEYHEIIEQLPLSLIRSMALLRELDDQVQEYQQALLPAVRSYISLRFSLAGRPFPPGTPPTNSTPIAGTGNEPNGKSSSVKGKRTESNAGTPVSASRSSSDMHAADGLDEGSSKSVSAVLHVDTPSADGQPGSVMSPTDVAPSTTTPTNGAPPTFNSPQKRPLVPPYPFAMQRSHSSFSLAVQKIREEAPPTTRAMLLRIAWLAAQAVKVSEEKLGVATAAYNSVDRHVRALDATIKEHETSLVLGLRPGTRPTSSMLSVGDAAILAAGDSAEEQLVIGLGGTTGATSSRTTSKKALERERKRMKERERKERRRREREEAAKAMAAEDAADVEPEDPVLPAVPGTPGSVAKLGMPVDPHEPRYCYCRQVSWGEMIGCDNDNCVNEWFHLPCVGLTEAPKGEKKWYCRDCAGQFERPSKKRKT